MKLYKKITSVIIQYYWSSNVEFKRKFECANVT